MGTKNAPSKFDCYKALAENEPYFVLMGRDPTASALVHLWADLRSRLGGTEPEKIQEALDVAEQMRNHATVLGKAERVEKANDEIAQMVRDAAAAPTMAERPYAPSYAPWSANQVASLNAYQKSGVMHPFTGTRAMNGDETVLIATADGWVEREGGPVIQTWAHPWMADWSWSWERSAEVPRANGDAMPRIATALEAMLEIMRADLLVTHASRDQSNDALKLMFDRLGTIESRVKKLEQHFMLGPR